MANQRRSTAAVGVVALLAVLVPASNLDSASVLHLPPPSEHEMVLLEQLAGLNRGGFRLFADEGFADLLQSRAQRFELFRSLRHPRSSRRLLATMPFGSLIADAAAQYRLDGLLVAAVVEAESGFDPAAVSPRGALGLMQLMPETAAQYGVAQPSDPRANVRGGARYLRDLLQRFDYDLELTLAAYNAGPGNVVRYGGVPPFPQTTTYVDRVLRIYLRLHHEVWLEAMGERVGALAQASERAL